MKRRLGGYRLAFKAASLVSRMRPAHEVWRGVNKTIAEVFTWSLECAAIGKGPLLGFYGEEFARGSSRSSLAGKPLAGGYRRFACTVETRFVCCGLRAAQPFPATEALLCGVQERWEVPERQSLLQSLLLVQAVLREVLCGSTF